MKGAGGGGSAHKLSTQASARNLGGGRGRGHGRGGLGSKARSTRLSFGADGSAHASASAAASPSSSQQHLQDAGDFDLSSTLTSTRDLRATSAFTGGLESVARSGQLMKRGHLRKTWKTRHFHLEEGFLTYSTSAPAEGGKRKGQVCLLGTTLLIEPRPDKEDEARAQGAQTPFIFKLTLADGTPARKTLLLCAESQSNMHAWIASIGSSWVDPNGTTGMMRAAQAGYLDDMKLMVTVGVDINLQNNDGWTALMIAAREGHLDCIAELLRHGANLNMQSLTGNTCLMDAVRDQHDEVLQFLLDRGADPNIHNDDGSSAAMVAVQGGDHRSLRILIAHDADLATPNDLGLTPLMQVARAQPALDDTSSEEEEEEEEEEGEGEGEGGEGGGGGGGAPREPKDRMAGVMACLELLIDQGVDLDAAQPSTGDNAMMCAARVGNAAAVRLLAQRGANVHHINHAHKTVGDVAELTGQGKIFEFLSAGLPSFTSYPPDDHMFDEGTDVLLVARAAGLPAPYFEWRKDAAPIADACARDGLEFEVTTRTIGAVGSAAGDRRRPSMAVRATSGRAGKPGAAEAEIESEVTLRIKCARRGGAEGNYSVRALNAVGVARGRMLEVRASNPPVVTDPPQGCRVDPGGTCSVSFGYSAEPKPSFQWFKLPALVLQDGETEYEARERMGEKHADRQRKKVPVPAPHGTAPTLKFENVVIADDGRYFCEVTNSAGHCSTADGGHTASLHVNRPPSELGQPTAFLSEVLLAVDVAGSPRPALQWRCDGKELRGETKAELAVDPAQKGEYSVVATNSAGSVTIQVAKFPVEAPLRLVEENLKA